MVSNWAIDWRLDVGCWMLDVRCSQGFMERFPRCKTSRIEPLNRSLNRRKTSNTQHPTSNNQWFPIGPLIGGWVLDVRCWMFDVRCSQGFRTGGQRHSLKFNVLSDVGVGLERAGLIITDPLGPSLVQAPFRHRLGLRFSHPILNLLRKALFQIPMGQHFHRDLPRWPVRPDVLAENPS